LIAKTHIPQTEAVQLKAGNTAEINLAGLDEPVKSQVSLVSPALDPGSTTVEVWVEVRKPDPALRPGMTVPVSMTAKAAKDAIVVPAASVFHSEEAGDYVMLAGSDGKAHLTKVQSGIRNKDSVQIVSGINEGDPVITSGAYALPDGTRVEIEKPGAEEKAGADTGGDEKKATKDTEGSKSDPKKKASPGGAAKSAGSGKE
jgi:RND family efflux transporter MFP subunit